MTTVRRVGCVASTWSSSASIPQGNIYAGEVEGQRLVKWVRVRK